MISYPKDRTTERKEHMRGGGGTILMTHIFGEHTPHLRLFAEITAEPGCSIGTHRHDGEAELFYVLEGEATVLDGDAYTTLRPGDAHLCRAGETHQLVNNGDKTTRVLAIIPTMAE